MHHLLRQRDLLARKTEKGLPRLCGSGRQDTSQGQEVSQVRPASKDLQGPRLQEGPQVQQVQGEVSTRG